MSRSLTQPTAPLRCMLKLVVGADGRSSTGPPPSPVSRSSATIRSTTSPGSSWTDWQGCPDDHDVLAADGDLLLLMFHQGGGVGPAYTCARAGQGSTASPVPTPWLASLRPGGTRAATRCPAWWRRGVPPGHVLPIRAMTPGLTRPLRNRVVLVGDAAGGQRSDRRPGAVDFHARRPDCPGPDSGATSASGLRSVRARRSDRMRNLR